MKLTAGGNQWLTGWHQFLMHTDPAVVVTHHGCGAAGESHSSSLQSECCCWNREQRCRCRKAFAMMPVHPPLSLLHDSCESSA